MLTLSPDAAIMFVLALASGMLCGSLLVSWRSLGGGRHSLFWAGAFGIAAVQWGVIGGYNSFMAHTPLTFVGATWSGAVMSVLLCMGYRARIGAPRHARLAAAVVLLSGVLIAVPYFTRTHLNIPLSVPQIVRALCLPIAALTLVGPGRRPTIVESMNAAVLIAFGLFSAVVAYFRLTDCGCETNGGRTVLLLGLPVLFVGTGIAAVQLLASDLAGQLRRAARTDPLTRALNRRGFEEAAQHTLIDAQRRARPVSVALFDLDHFKTINDAFGHARGDAVLEAVADRVHGAIRDIDLFGRVGGEEFALLLKGADTRKAVQAVERIRAALATLPPLPDGRSVTASFGVAPVNAIDLSQAIRNADEALYRAKSDGRNCIRCAALPTPAPADPFRPERESPVEAGTETQATLSTPDRIGAIA